MRPFLQIIPIVGFAAACNDWISDLERAPDDVPLAEIVDVTSTASSIPADGSSTVRIEARLAGDASARLVTFTTNAGRFVETNAATVMAAVVRDASGRLVAGTLLRSDTLRAVAIVRGTVGEYYDTVSVHIVK